VTKNLPGVLAISDGIGGGKLAPGLQRVLPAGSSLSAAPPFGKAQL